MSDPKPTLAESALKQLHQQEADRIEREASNELQVDVAKIGDEAFVEASAQHTTKSRWSFTAYVKKVLGGPWSTGGRIGKKF
jgi:hypothetical protein